MPTYELRDEFLRDWKRLTPEQQHQFTAAVKLFVADLKSGSGIRASLGIKRFRGVPGVWEFRWAPDGWPLFRYGDSPQPAGPSGNARTSASDVHVIWLRIGTHDIYKPH
ncbi:MAG TPA: hypothetical protein VF120_15870 [Ktedonobacterales bacterium]